LTSMPDDIGTIFRFEGRPYSRQTTIFFYSVSVPAAGIGIFQWTY
jgi:hypothetical protein